MGGVVAYRLRSDLRRRWRSLLALAALVGVLGGVVLAAAAGARRTASAYDRLLEITNPPELLVSPAGDGIDPTPFYEELASLQEVRALRLVAGMPVVVEAGTPSERLAESFAGGAVLAPFDAGFSADMGRPHVIDGRIPDPQRADELLVSERFAAITGVEVGEHIDAVLLSGDTSDASITATADQGEPIRLTVTGIGVMFDEVVPYSGLSESGSAIGTAALADLVDRRDRFFEGAMVDVQPGADLDAVTSKIEELGRRDELGTGGFVFLADQVALARQVRDAIRPWVVSLTIASVAIALVGVLVVGQAISRTSREPLVEIYALRAMGSEPGDRTALTLARAAVVGAGGAFGAVVVAIAVSGLFPISVARVAEPDPGVEVDGVTLAIGAAAIVVLTVASAVPAAVRVGRERSRRPVKPSRLAGAAAAAGLPPAAVQGVRFAAGGGGVRPVPLRSAIIAMTVAIMSVFATVAFAASLLALLDTPSRYGQGWDRMLDAQFGPAPVGRVLDRLESRPDVRGIAAGNYGDISVNGVAVPAFDLEVLRGELSIGIVEGAPATAPEEIVLGSETMDRLDVEVGDVVEVDGGGGLGLVRVTGRGVFPQMGQGSFSTTGLGVGAQLGGHSLVSFGDVGDVPSAYELDGRRYNFVAIDVAGRAEWMDAEVADLAAAAAADGAFLTVRLDQPPSKIRDLDGVRMVPVAMAGALTVVAVCELVHLLVTSVRERRQELALLGALGFSRGQLYATVSWQASLIALTALVIGVPAGVALGRTVWRSFADGLGAAAPAETPWTWLALILIATVVLANVVAAVPGRSAARTRPAVVLREE